MRRVDNFLRRSESFYMSYFTQKIKLMEHICHYVCMYKKCKSSDIKLVKYKVFPYRFFCGFSKKNFFWKMMHHSLYLICGKGPSINHVDHFWVFLTSPCLMWIPNSIKWLSFWNVQPLSPMVYRWFPTTLKIKKVWH